MYKQDTPTPASKPAHKAAGPVGNRAALKPMPAPPLSLWRRDPLYTQLTQLGLITPHFEEEYRLSRRQATGNLLRQLVFIQNLYQGRRFAVDKGSEELRIRAMDLNTHLISTAGFGTYSNAAKINILYQLRKVVEKMLETYCGVAKRPG